MKGDFTMSLDNSDYQLLMKKMDGLNALEQNAVIQHGLKEGSKVFEAEGKRRINSYLGTVTGRLKKSLKKKVVKGKKKKATKGKAYIGFNKFGRHAHLANFGTVKRFKRNGQSTGTMFKSKGCMWNGKPYVPSGKAGFWTDTFEAKKYEAADTLMDACKIAINQILTRNR